MPFFKFFYTYYIFDEDIFFCVYPKSKYLCNLAKIRSHKAEFWKNVNSILDFFLVISNTPDTVYIFQS